jgi:hypothetical protein
MSFSSRDFMWTPCSIRWLREDRLDVAAEACETVSVDRSSLGDLISNPEDQQNFPHTLRLKAPSRRSTPAADPQAVNQHGGRGLLRFGRSAARLSKGED